MYIPVYIYILYSSCRAACCTCTCTCMYTGVISLYINVYMLCAPHLSRSLARANSLCAHVRAYISASRRMCRPTATPALTGVVEVAGECGSRLATTQLSGSGKTHLHPTPTPTSKGKPCRQPRNVPCPTPTAVALRRPTRRQHWAQVQEKVDLSLNRGGEGSGCDFHSTGRQGARRPGRGGFPCCTTATCSWTRSLVRRS